MGASQSAELTLHTACMLICPHSKSLPANDTKAEIRSCWQPDLPSGKSVLRDLKKWAHLTGQHESCVISSAPSGPEGQVTCLRPALDLVAIPQKAVSVPVELSFNALSPVVTMVGTITTIERG